MKMYTYNIWNNCYIWLLPDEEVFCPKCNGRGAKIISSRLIPQGTNIIKCYFCDGNGKLDWITNITGYCDSLNEERHIKKETSLKLKLNWYKT